MAWLSDYLEIDTCPHCGKAHPTLQRTKSGLFETKAHSGKPKRWWGIYVCQSCGGVVTAWAPKASERQNANKPHAYPIYEIYPSTLTINVSIPEKPREFLRQAQESLHAPAGAIMLSASAIDAMLKEKGCTEGSLYDRIDKAAKDHLITDSMAQWAHQVRLDANEQRHADKDVGLPTQDDAKRTFDFAMAFAEYLFVLPSKVTRGIADTQPPN